MLGPRTAFGVTGLPLRLLLYMPPSESLLQFWGESHACSVSSSWSVGFGWGGLCEARTARFYLLPLLPPSLGQTPWAHAPESGPAKHSVTSDRHSMRSTHSFQCPASPGTVSFLVCQLWRASACVEALDLVSLGSGYVSDCWYRTSSLSSFCIGRFDLFWLWTEVIVLHRPSHLLCWRRRGHLCRFEVSC